MRRIWQFYVCMALLFGGSTGLFANPSLADYNDPVGYPAAWPTDWGTGYTYGGVPVADGEGGTDPSTGGTTPQQDQDFSHGGTGNSFPSFFFKGDGSILYFRFRVISTPSALTGSGKPFNSRTWNIIFDTDGDGFKEFIIMLNGVGGKTDNEPDDIWVTYDNAAANSFAVTPGNIWKQDSAKPISGETIGVDGETAAFSLWNRSADPFVLDYGRTRVTQIDTNNASSSEYYLDIQVPVAALDATGVGGPKIGSNSRFTIAATSSASNTDPTQKDFLYPGTFTMNPGTPLPTGDLTDIIGNTYQPPQIPLITVVTTNCASPVNLFATALDTMTNSGATTVTSTVVALQFQYFYDANTNGIADDAAVSWLNVVNNANGTTNATSPSLGQWNSSWITTNLPVGNYIIRAVATDNQNNITFSDTETPTPVTANFTNVCGLPASELQIFKTGPTNVFATSNFTYTVTVTNAGPSTGTGIIVKDALPTNVVFVSASSGGTALSNVVTWPSMSLTNKGTTNFTVIVTAPNYGVSFTNTAWINAITTSDPVLGNNTNTAATTVTAQADLATFKTGPTNVFAGTNFAYTITLTNIGPSDATGVIVTDTLPASVTFVTASSSGTFTNGVVTWPTLAIFTNHATTNFTVTVTAPGTGTLTNRVSSGGTSLDPVTTNNDGSGTNAIVITTITPQADLQVTKAGTNSVLASSNLTYTITLTNLGPSTAASVIVTDTLPANVTFVNASSGGALTNGLVSWPAIASFTNGASTNFTVTITAPASGTLTNRASAGGTTFDPAATNNNGTAINAAVVTTIIPEADIQATKTGPTNVFAGTNFSYTISLTNSGPSTATSLVVTDSLPTGVVFVTATAGFTFTNGLVTWPIATFTNGAATNFNITVTAPASGTLTNRVSTGGATFDPVSDNNDGTAAGAVVTTTVTPQSDLQATKTGPTNVFAGTNFSYTVTLTNAGPSTATSVVVTDALPSAVTFVTASTGFIFTNGVVTWPIASFTNGATTNFSITVTAPASGTITNRVTAGSGVFDPTSNNNDGTAAGAMVATTITPQADLQTTKSGPTNVLAGTNFSYTISLTNSGPSTATGIIVTDALPSGVTFVTATTGFTLTNGLVTWPIASFTNGAVTNFNVTVTAPSNSATFTNIASSGSTTFDATLNNNNGSAANAKVTTFVTPVADIQTTKTGPTNVFAGTNFIYTISVTNLGPSTAGSISVTDALPAGVTFVSASGGGTSSSNTVVWQILNFTNTASTNFTLTVTAPADASTLTNVVASGSDTLDVVGANNDGSAAGAKVITTVTAQSDLAIAKAGPTTVLAGTNYSYTITLTNRGPSMATSIVVTDTLPTEVTFVTATAGYTFTNGLVTWPIASLSSGTVTNFTITVTAPASGTVTNYSSSGSPVFDPLPGNNNGSAGNASVTTTVTPQADLLVTKTGPTNVFAGTNFSYTITLTNTGPSTATSIIVTDALPIGVTFVTASTGFTASNGIVTWSIASFTNEQVTNFTVTVQAPPSGTLTNVASGGGTTLDLTPANNDGSSAAARVITTITPQADLQVTKTGPASVYAVTNFNYTITVTNIGPSTATSVVITDALPTDVTFVTASSGYALTNGLVTFPITSLASGTVTNFTITVTAPASGTLTNRASGGSPIFDPVSNNNDGSATNALVTTTVIPLADIQTTKTGPVTKGAGTNIIYTISVTNAGPSTASNVVVLDTLPPGVTVMSTSPSGVATTNSVTWTLGTLTNGASTNLMLTLTAGTGPITNLVSSTSDTLDPVPANNDGTSPNARVVTAITQGVSVSGFVYNDANANGFKDASEVGTGLAIYAKIFLATQTSGPAVAAVLVNSATGAYTLSNVVAGTYTIVIDDNNNLADVTPNLPSGWTGTEAAAQSRNNIVVLNVPVPNQNFGLVQAVTIKGNVFNDNGVSSGTANDGIKNGGEIGIANTIVKLTDASGASVYSSATTAGDGSYTLLVPGAVTNGVQVKIVEVNLTGYRSTGASVGNTSGTYERTNDVVTFTFAAGTLYTGVNFGDIAENEFTTDGQQSALPGSIVLYSHTFTAHSAGTVTFSTAKLPTPNIPAWNNVLYRDNNCNAQIDSGDTMITGAIAVVAEQKICLLVKEFVPTAAPFNAQDQITVSANFIYANAVPALSAAGTHTDLTTVGTPTSAGLQLLKEVDKASAAPGDVITYTISYLNESTMSLSNMVIYDATPPFTLFLSATNGLMGPGLNSVDIITPTVGESGSVRWTFSGALVPTGSGKVIYKVTIE